MRRVIFAASLLGLFCSPLQAKPAAAPEAVAQAALRAAPVWDGHNDVAEQLRLRRLNMLADFDFTDTTGTADPAKSRKPMQTDLVRLRKGRVGAQFWSVYVSASLTEAQAVQATLEQIDVMKRLIARHPRDLVYCETAACAEQAMRSGKIASLLGMEGGHSIGGSLAVLRQMYALGARYMTLAHFKNNAWADSATDDSRSGGLSPFGASVVREMQRLGMLVDLAHVSEATMMDALSVAAAPVIVSHSNAYGVVPHPRNVPDGVLDALKTNGGIVMVNVYPAYTVEAARLWTAERDAQEARFKALNRGNTAAAKEALAKWEAANPVPRGSPADLADHIDHIAKRIGADHVGLGGDFDGLDTPIGGMDDVSTYPALFVELAKRGWVQADLEKLSSRNMLRVLKAAETYARQHRLDLPIENPTVF